MEPQTDLGSISLLKIIIASTTVLGLMGLLAWGLKYFAARGWITPAAGSARRLKLIESLALDARRRLVIVKCDNAEHLLLLGANQDSIVATNLTVSDGPPSTTLSSMDS